MEKEIITKRGPVKLIRDLEPGSVENLVMGEGLGIFFHYRYEDAHKTKEVLSNLCVSECQRLACVVKDTELVGYVTVVCTAEGSRWRSINDSLLETADGLSDPVLMELGSIEISKPWRSLGLARELLRFMFIEGGFSDKIVFSRELSWHWDLKSSGLTVYEYRSMLHNLFESVGFRYCETDDEEIGYSGENMLMARVGEDVPPETALLFHRSVCRSEPRGWGWG